MASEHAVSSMSFEVPTVCDDSEKISVYLINGKPKIFNAKDAVTLREYYRIVGVLVGCLPRNPRQNVHLGLPLQLMPEELSLLLEKGYVKLLKEKAMTAEESRLRTKAVEQETKSNFEAQQELYRADRRQEMLRQMSHILEGKKAKRQRLANAPSTEEAAQGEPTPSTGEEARPSIEGEVNGSIEAEGGVKGEEEVCLDRLPVTPTPEKHMLRQLFTETPWRREREEVGGDWTFPQTALERLRCAVFQDLWEKQYYLTSGQKFGGDFLAYPGDPSRYHSFHIVICVDRTRPLPALDIVSLGRLGSNVRKTILLASLDQDRQTQYTSLQWTGMS